MWSCSPNAGRAICPRCGLTEAAPRALQREHAGRLPQRALSALRDGSYAAAVAAAPRRVRVAAARAYSMRAPALTRVHADSTSLARREERPKSEVRVAQDVAGIVAPPRRAQGSQFFVSPSDSLAMIVANADLIPQFKKAGGLKGCARSMPTSGALDLVAQKKGLPYFEVPTGWKFFGNLMDSGTHYFPDKKSYTPFVCGEESFGTGSDHVREKDGMWAVLAWLQILAAKTLAKGRLVTVEEVAIEHWKEYGRNYYARYDYEGVDKPKSEEMMKAMADKAGQLVGQKVQGMEIATNDVFEYHDPVDGSLSKNQGLRFIFTDKSRIIFRLSGTGVAGATVRVYLEKYVAPSGDIGLHAFDVVKPLAAIAMELSGLPTFTGRDTPTVIT